MLSQINYLIRSKVDGKYLVARLPPEKQEKEANYLLLFQENYDALSYINTHGADFRDRLTVESVSSLQLKSVLQRWGYKGIGLVEDPLIPKIKFMTN